MKFCWTTINIKNMEESLKFYQEVVGLKLNRTFAAPTAKFAFLCEGEAQLELIQYEKSEDIIYNGLSLGFEITSLDEKIEELKLKNINFGEIINPSPDTRFFFIKGPDGENVQFVEHK